MDDVDILNEERKVFFIGPKKKKLELEMLGISKYYKYFIPRFLAFLSYFKKDLELLDFPTGNKWNKKKELDSIRSQVQRIFSLDKVRKEFTLLLKKVGYLKFSRRYFEEHVKPIQLVDIFLRVYKFNIDDFKKKVLETELLLILSDRPSQTSTDNLSSADLSERIRKHTGDGTGGGLKKKLKPRFQQLKK
jgi:hypothetical protein